MTRAFPFVGFCARSGSLLSRKNSNKKAPVKGAFVVVVALAGV
ncbi:hypothetical protein ABN072_01760 [Providencia rettgeri]